MGHSQLRRFKEIAAKKQRVADRYLAALKGVPGLRLPREAPWAKQINWLYMVHIDEVEFGVSAKSALKALERLKIETRPMFTPLHEVGVYANLNVHECGNAENLGATGLALPSSVALEDQEIDRVVEALLQIRA